MNTPTPRTCPRCKNDFSRCDEMFDCANRRDIPTPITDGASFGAYIADGSGHVVKSVVEVKVAKKLERDLAAAQAEVLRLNKWADGMTDSAMKERATGEAYQRELREQLAAAKSALAQAQEALEQEREERRLAVEQGDSLAWQLQAAQEARKAAEARAESYRQDAERYRWLRENPCLPFGVTKYRSEPMEYYAGDALTAAIDAAREGK